MKFFAVTAVLVIPTLAMPQPAPEGAAMGARDLPKFSQYKSVDDCKNDKDILYHAAPVTRRCINIDSQTNAFFVNTAAFLASKLYSGSDCNGNTLGVSGGSCIDKGQWNSYKQV